MIVQQLREIQNEHGFLPDTELVKLSRDTGTPLYKLQEVASFFPHFRQEWNPPPYVDIKVCRDMSCHLAGAAELLLAEDGLLPLVKEGKVTVEGTSCLGRCDRAPAVVVSRHDHHHPEKSFHDRVYAGLTEKELKISLEAIIRGDNPPPEDTPDWSRAIIHTGWQIDVYRQDPALAESPYAISKKYLQELPRGNAAPSADKKPADELLAYNEKWLDHLKQSGLQGMGGAGAPAHKKWSDVLKAAGSIKYIVCNGDESEPGTFKDRELLLRTPHLVVEGVILAGLITGAVKGYVYIRHEYREQINRTRAAIAEARTAGVCGQNLLNSGRSFEVEVYESPGGYICGEQTALIEAMEDRRSQPRNRPPEIETNGLFNMPTVVNNVETLAWAPFIMHRGGEAYAKAGKPFYNGRRFFSISGDLCSPGVFEVEDGTTLGELIHLAGGMKGGPLKAVATSGPSGGFWPALLPVKPRDPAKPGSKPDMLSDFYQKHLVRDGQPIAKLDIQLLPLDLNFFRGMVRMLGLPENVEGMLGAGLVVYNSTRDILEQARNCTQFFRNESCGKCVPCRIGSQKLVELGTELLRKRGGDPFVLNDSDGEPTVLPQGLLDRPMLEKTIREYAKAMQLTAICGLGYVAPGPLNTAVQFFGDDVFGKRD